MQLLDLTKKFELNLTKAGFTKIPVMEVKMAIDKSGSMYEEFTDGFVSKTIEMFMAVAQKFDDNGQLEYTFFNWGAESTKTVSVDNYKSIRLPSPNGGTNYLPALEELLQEESAGFFGLFGKKKNQTNNLKYIAFLTDGAANDGYETIEYINKLDKNTFVQFIAIGTQVDMHTLKRLGSHPNTSYFVIPDPHEMTEDELYSKIANERLLEWTNAR